MTYHSFSIKNLSDNDNYRLLSELETLGSAGVEEKENEVLVYFESTIDIERIKETIIPFTSDFIHEIIEEQNWNAVWESNFDPVSVDDFCYIKASFHPEQEGYEHTIHITPKMSFGTGHHATTYQVIQMMRGLDWKGKKVLDFGTGTGILAILASHLGATTILAIDNDPWSVENTEENVAQNNAAHIDIRLATLSDVDDSDFDLIIANINRHILLEYMAQMADSLISNGNIIMSGILEEDELIISEAAKPTGLELIQKSRKDKWLCLLFQKK